MNSAPDRRLEPSDISPEILKQLDGLAKSGDAALVGSHGERIELPKPLNDLLMFVVQSMQRRQAILLVPEDEAFTTQAAANFLGMSRPYLLRLLEADRIPHHRVGTHRRIMFKDLLAFRDARSKERGEVLTELTKLMVEEGVYDRRLELEE